MAESRLSPKQKLIRLAKARFTQADEAEKKQRERELADLRFYAGDQWPQDIRDARAGQGGGVGPNALPPVPARPCLTINKTREPVRQVLNQERQADMGASLVPSDDFEGITGPIDDTEIELREGLLRRIQRQSHAADARTWAFARAVICGTGYYGVTTQYAEGLTFDQEIKLRRFYNQAAVGLDPAHEQPDGSDAEWGFIATRLTWDQYVAEFPERNGKKNRLCDADGAEAWQLLGDDYPGWFETEGEGDKRTCMVRVIEYFYVERTSETIVQLADGSVVPLVEAPPNVPVTGKRDLITKSIQWCKIDGCDDDVLDETDGPGQFIPIIKVTGDELQPYDSERRREGMVRPAIDSQRGFNYMISKQVEMVGLTPIPPLMVAEGQVEGYEEWYNQANTRTLPYLPYKTKDLEGNPVGPPQAAPRETPIQAVAISVREFDSAIRATTSGQTGLADPSLGGVDPAARSGKAIRAILEEKSKSTSNFLDNLKRSVNYETQIINDLLEPIYGRPGRLVRMLNAQQEPEAALVNQPFVMQGPPKNQRPVPAQEGQQDAKKYTLTKGALFNIAIKVGRDYDTRREEEGSVLSELMGAKPEMFAPVMGDLYFENQDWPGHKEMAERMKVMLAPPVQQLLSKEEPIPPQVQDMLTKAQNIIKMLAQELEGKTKIIETEAVQAQRDTALEQAKQEAETQRARYETDAKIRIEEMKSNTQFGVAELKAGLDNYKMRLEHIETLMGHEAEAAQLRAEQAHDANQLDANRQQEAQMAGADRQAGAIEGDKQRQHEGGQKQADRNLQREEGAQGRAFEADQAERARQAEAQAAQEDGA